MWSDYLRRQTRGLFSTEYPFLSFGSLATVSIEAGIPDETWYQSEEGNEAASMGAGENQPDLIGL